MSLTREEILNAKDLEEEEVEVPEWGGTVCVRRLSGTDRDAYEASLWKEEGDERVLDLSNARTKRASLGMIGPDGEKLFTLDEAILLGTKSSAALWRVVEVVDRLSAMNQDAKKEAGKNSPGDRSEDSTSD